MEPDFLLGLLQQPLVAACIMAHHSTCCSTGTADLRLVCKAARDAVDTAIELLALSALGSDGDAMARLTG